jgi:hypothetical protein
MPRYFFNVLEDPELVADLEGSDLPDLDAIRHKAIAAARAILSQWAKKDTLPLSYAFTVTDKTGKTVLTLPFSEAVTVV